MGKIYSISLYPVILQGKVILQYISVASASLKMHFYTNTNVDSGLAQHIWFNLINIWFIIIYYFFKCLH